MLNAVIDSAVIMMIQAGRPVDETVDKVKDLLEAGN